MLNKDEMDFVISLIKCENECPTYITHVGEVPKTWSEKFIEIYYQKAIMTEIKNNNPETK